MEFRSLSFLEDAVASKLPNDIRRALLSYIKKCLGDTKEIESALAYVKKSVSEETYNAIWEEYDGGKLETDKSKWNKMYFALVEVDLSDNFAKERFSHVLEVGNYVYGTTNIQKPNKVTSTTSKNTTKVKDEAQRKPSGNFPLAILVGGGILLGIVLITKLVKR